MPDVALQELAEAGPTIYLLRENDVSDVTLLQLIELGLTSVEQIMAAHNDGLNEVGIKKGPRMQILKTQCPLKLKFEDTEVKDVLEQFYLGKYRARCAEEQIDIKAFRNFEDEPDAALEKEMGIQAEDIEAFRKAVRSVEN